MNNQTATQILNKLTAKDYIAIVPHRGPDGDAIGSAVALKLFINQFHQNVEIFCVDKAPPNTDFLLKNHQLHQDLNPNIFKTICFVDCGSKNMSKYETKIPDLFDRPDIFKINIDHHQSNDQFGDLNLVDTKSSSTTEILFNLFTYWQKNLNLNFSITPEMANALLCGIHFDTGSFKHPNTKLKTLKTAAELTKLGGNNQLIAYELFHKTNCNKLKLWGKVLQKTKLTTKSIVTSAATLNDFKDCSANSKDLEGIIDYLNAIPNKKFSLLLTEDNQNGTNGIKGSLRTLDNSYNLNQLAKIFGGGGHKMAAGFRIEGQIKEQKYWAIE